MTTQQIIVVLAAQFAQAIAERDQARGDLAHAQTEIAKLRAEDTKRARAAEKRRKSRTKESPDSPDLA